jgi:hypothetical protein
VRISAAFLISAFLVASSIQLAVADVQNFLNLGQGDVPAVLRLLARHDVAGAQVVYSWKSLETAEGRYDFSAIERDLATTNGLHKKLFVQLQDRFFQADARNLPDYLLHDSGYGGGLVPQVDNPGEGRAPVMGWVAQQWNPKLRHRYQELIQKLADRFDGRIFGLNLPESAIDIDLKHDRTGFTCDAYFEAEMENMKFARQVFSKSLVVQYVNFWPCEWANDHRYMSRAFETAARLGIGLGGPDIVPYRKAQMDNSYRFFHQYRNNLRVVAMAVQEPTLTYTNPSTGRKFTRKEFVDFAVNHLGAKIIFWSSSAHWLMAG